MTASLAKKLRREFKNNPKKGFVLGVLVLIAGYFWTPLIVARLRGNSADGSSSASTANSGSTTPNPSNMNPVAQSSAAAPRQTSAAPASTSAASYTWQQLAASIDEDPLMQPADSVVGRDPFQPPARAALEAKAREALAAAHPSITPVDVGVVLSSTIVGGQQPVARIAGTTYHVGDHVRAGKDGHQFDFVLAAIEPRGIVLTRDGRSFEVKMQRPHGGPARSPAAASESDLSDLMDEDSLPNDDGLTDPDADGGLGIPGEDGVRSASPRVP